MSAKLALFLAVFGTGPAAWPQDKHAKSAIPWRSDFKKGLEEARREGKLLLVHFGAEWCAWCKKMDGDTFSDEKVGGLCAKGFVSVALDVDKEKDLARKYLVERVPTAIVLLPEGELVEALDGYVAAAEFAGWLGLWSTAFGRLKEAEAKAAMKPEDREATCAWAEALLRFNQPARAVKVIEAALSLFPKDAALSAEERKSKAELLVHLGDACLDLLESPKRLLEIAGRIEAADPGGKLGFEVHALFLRAAADDMLSHELEEEALGLEKGGGKALSARRKADARKLQAGVLSKLEECLEKYPDSTRTDAVLVWTGHLVLEVRKDAAQARKMFQKVIEKYPDSDFADEARQRLRDLGGDPPKSARKEK